MMKQIPKWEGLYSVTDDGRVWSHARKSIAGTGFKNNPGRWMKPHKFSRTSHLRVYLSKDGKKYPMMIHRLVATAFIPNHDNLPVVNHLDGDPTNNTLSNLEWTTQSGNCIHAVSLGLTKLPSQVGAKNSQSKLNDNKVIEMRLLKKHGMSISCLSKMFNVSTKTTRDAVNKVTWKHVETI